MAKAIPLRQALLFWLTTVGSAVLLYYGGQLSDFLIGDVHASRWIRWSGVLVGVLSIVPWMTVIALTLAVVDEYYRRIIFAGTALAFLLDILVHIGFNVAMDAQLLSPGSYIPELGVAILVWMAGIAVTSLYYRFRL
jgi:hypothetical protein